MDGWTCENECLTFGFLGTVVVGQFPVTDCISGISYHTMTKYD